MKNWWPSSNHKPEVTLNIDAVQSTDKIFLMKVIYFDNQYVWGVSLKIEK